MTVSSQTNKSGPYNGNGSTTIFNYGFRIVDEDHLKVIKTSAAGVETVLVIDTDYIVSDVGNPLGGQVATTVAPASGETITIIRNVPFTQETDLENQGAYYAETVEAAFDLSVMRDQQIQEQVDRSVKLPASADASDLDEVIANVQRLVDSADEIDTVAGIEANVVTVAGIAANVTTVAGVSANVTTVAGIAANVTTVAGIAANVTSVAGNATNINAVAGNATNINTVAGISANVTTVAGIAADVGVVADNVADITNFADVYYGPSATDPTMRRDGSPLQAGDFYFDTVGDELKVFTGVAWVAASAQAINGSGVSYTGNGVQTTFALPRSPGSIFNVFAIVGGTAQIPNVGFTLSGSNVVFTAAPGNGVAVFLRVLTTTANLNSAQADAVSYDNASSGLTATDVQAAINELAAGSVAGTAADDGKIIYYDHASGELKKAYASPKEPFADLRDFMDLQYPGGWTSGASGSDATPAINAAQTALRSRYGRGIIRLGPFNWRLLSAPSTTDADGHMWEGIGSQGTILTLDFSAGTLWNRAAVGGYSGGGARGISIHLPNGKGLSTVTILNADGDATNQPDQTVWEDIYATAFGDSYYFNGAQFYGVDRTSPQGIRGGTIKNWQQFRCRNAAFGFYNVVQFTVENIGSYSGTSTGNNIYVGGGGAANTNTTQLTIGGMICGGELNLTNATNCEIRGKTASLNWATSFDRYFLAIENAGSTGGSGGANPIASFIL